jgi:hypothetical protein
VIDDESLVKTRTNTCLSYASAIPSYSVAMASFVVSNFGFVFSSLTTKLAIANEQLSFILKNLSSNVQDASIPHSHREKNREKTVNFRKFINI